MKSLQRGRPPLAVLRGVAPTTCWCGCTCDARLHLVLVLCPIGHGAVICALVGSHARLLQSVAMLHAHCTPLDCEFCMQTLIRRCHCTTQCRVIHDIQTWQFMRCTAVQEPSRFDCLRHVGAAQVGRVQTSCRGPKVKHSGCAGVVAASLHSHALPPSGVSKCMRSTVLT